MYRNVRFGLPRWVVDVTPTWTFKLVKFTCTNGLTIDNEQAKEVFHHDRSIKYNDVNSVWRNSLLVVFVLFVHQCSFVLFLTHYLGFSGEVFFWWVISFLIWFWVFNKNKNYKKSKKQTETMTPPPPTQTQTPTPPPTPPPPPPPPPHHTKTNKKKTKKKKKKKTKKKKKKNKK